MQDRYDDAMFDYSKGGYDSAIAKLKAILAEAPGNFDAQLSLGMAYYRKADYARAIEEGHKAEKLKPREQLVHTNLSLFYMKAGDKPAAEHHGLQARIASWHEEAKAGSSNTKTPPGSELDLAKPKPQPIRLPTRFPDMPWKKRPKIDGGDAPSS